MQKNIDLVKKWLADPDSVSEEELIANDESALSCYIEKDDHISFCASYASSSALSNDPECAGHWVKEYEKNLKMESKNGS